MYAIIFPISGSGAHLIWAVRLLLTFMNDTYAGNVIPGTDARAYDFTGGKLVSELYPLADFQTTAVFDGAYLLPGATGLKNVAT